MPAIKPLLTYLSEDYWKPIIETDLSQEEITMIDERIKDYEEDPSTFVPLENVH